jgi:hypothetical protein
MAHNTYLINLSRLNTILEQQLNRTPLFFNWMVDDVEGVIRFSGAGTYAPAFAFSAAPGGSPTVGIGSFFLLTRIGAGGDETKGTWS